jgi:hypothetical protein
MFMKYSLDQVFNMFTNVEEKHLDEFYISTSKFLDSYNSRTYD